MGCEGCVGLSIRCWVIEVGRMGHRCVRVLGRGVIVELGFVVVGTF